MHYPQIVVFESDSALAHSLEPVAQAHRWLLRQSRQAPACLHLLSNGGPAVLVLKIGRHLVREFTFLDEVHASQPDVPILAVGDTEDSTVMGLALELGASFVILPPQQRQQLGDVVARLMETAIERSRRQRVDVEPAKQTAMPEPGNEPES